MKYILLALVLVGCTNDNAHLKNRIVTDKAGCEYVVRLNIGDTVLLTPIRDSDCKADK